MQRTIPRITLRVLVTMSFVLNAATASAAFRLEEATISEIHAAMVSGELTARRLVEMYLERIAAYDRSGPALNAVILVNPNAIARAEALDEQLARSGLSGSLHGIPILLKDNVETGDMATTGGSLALEGYRPKADAFLARKLREAGAVIVAKVNLTEFAASGITRSSLLGQTLNPYDLTRTPGGSSGGTGAAVAANFGVAGIGTDTVNSIRSPASANNLVGIRPTRGLVSRSGVIPYALTQDMAGPIARTVDDAARVLDAIAGYDPDDPTTAWSVGRIESYARAVGTDGLREARLGVLRSFFGRGDVHRDVTRVTNEALAVMRQLGAELVELDADIDADELISEVSVSGYELDAHLSAYLRASGTSVASLSDVLASGKYEPMLEGLYERALRRSVDDPEYEKRLVARWALRDQVMKLMADHRLDAIVYPHQKRLVVPLGEDQVDRNGVLGAITGFPAITVPGGFSPKTASAPLGVPVGVEFLGRPFTEPILIRLASAFEHETQHRRAPVSTPPLRDP